MDRTIVTQKIENKSNSAISMAIKYFSVLSALNGLKWSPKQIELIAFMSIRGSISSGGAKEQFVQLFNTTKATIGNIVYVLAKQGYLVYEGDRVMLHPQLRTNCSGELVLQIHLSHE